MAVGQCKAAGTLGAGGGVCVCACARVRVRACACVLLHVRVDLSLPKGRASAVAADGVLPARAFVAALEGAALFQKVCFLCCGGRGLVAAQRV